MRYCLWKLVVVGLYVGRQNFFPKFACMLNIADGYNFEVMKSYQSLLIYLKAFHAIIVGHSNKSHS